MARRPLTVPTSGTVAAALDYGETPTPLAVWVTPDGVVVGGPGAWQQLSSLIPQAYAANWAVPDWYIDGVVGLDTNNGTTALTPLRTGAELLRRLGPYAMWSQSVTIHVLANGMTDALIVRGVLLLASSHLDIIGTPTLLANAGTVATYTGINHATPVAPQVSTTLIADWTGYQWKRLRCTAGAVGTVGAVTWVACANPAGAGLNIARTPRWSRVKVTTTPIYEMVNPAVGDTIVVESVPSIPAITLLLDGPVPTAKSPLYANRQWSIDSIACQQISLGGTALATWGLSYIFGSVVNSIQQIGQLWVAGSAEPKVGCLVDNQDTSGSTIGSSNFVGLWQACLFGKGSTTAFTYSNQQSQYNTCVFQGCKITVNSYGYASLFDVQLFDVAGATTPTISVSWGGNCQISSASGSGNAGYGVRVFQNCNIGLSAAGTFNIVAAVSTFRIDDAPAFNLTLAQFRQASDYAQKGITPAMVAGATTVTVPWYANTTQRVQVTHAAFAGTPGILSVQQTSTTQFVVTSSNALDTSTVNWTISPLGRNIFVSTL